MSVMQGLLEVVARLDVLSEEERRRATREEWKRVEEAGWEVVRRAEGVEVKKEKKEEKEEEEEEEEVEEVRVGWWKCRGPCVRELEMNADNFFRTPSSKRGFESKCKACKKEKVVIPKGFKMCSGGCGMMLKENGENFYDSKSSMTGFSKDCKSCHDARFGKKDEDVPDGRQRCKGECGQVLKLSGENFARATGRSGFQSRCRSCYAAEVRTSRDAARGDKPKRQVRQRPQEDLPDGHQRCMGECSRVLKMSAENFSRNKSARSGFQPTCKMCKSAEQRARKAAKKRARVESEHVDELPEERVERMPLVRVDELSGSDDDEEVISD